MKYDLILDIHREIINNKIIIDNSDKNILYIGITLQDKEYEFPRTVSAMVSISKPSGTIVKQKCKIYGNCIHVDLSDNTRDELGVYDLEITCISYLTQTIFRFSNVQYVVK